MNQTPHWQLPPGCSRGLWDYVHSRIVAEDYDAFFEHHGLLRFDQQVLQQWLANRGGPGAVIADLGCGTGRALIPLVRSGFRGLAIDLSDHMLHEVAKKVELESLDIRCLKSNWVELDGVPDDSVDHCISMFSTLGMIQGRLNRRRALAHTRRILRPGGLFVLHVHNLWHNVQYPGGAWWVVRSAAASWGREREFGDKYFPYRGVQNMFLHVFTRRELRRLLRQSGFQALQWIDLDGRNQGPLKLRWLLPAMRSAGWIVVCK